jgi:ribosomal protein S18 acetylase RimI-like enzyme
MAKNINKHYIYKLFVSSNTKIVLYSIDNTYLNDLDNFICGLIYTIVKTNNEINIYIMFTATKYKCRNYGYGSLFVKEFIEYIKEKNKQIKTNIVLDSLKSAATFYENLGFKWITNEKKYNSIFDINEKNKNEHIIMVYKII